MNMNDVADAVMSITSTLHTRVYRTKPPQTPVFPYIICTLDSTIQSNPSSDVYLDIDVIDDPNATVRAMETIADTFQNAMDNRIIINENVNLHAVLEQRQYVSNKDLISSQMINMRFVCRVYFN